MLTLYKSLEYCCQLWSPWRAVQRSFTYRISLVCMPPGLLEPSGGPQMYSLERRRDRFMIIYVWKIMQGYTNDNIRLTFGENLCLITPTHLRASTRVKTFKEYSFSTRGAVLFNRIPNYLRDPGQRELSTFKSSLDTRLKTILNQPSLPHYPLPADSSSIVDQLAHSRATTAF